MAQAHFYCMDYRTLVEGALKKSVELTFPAGLEVDISDHASSEPPAAFSPVIWYTTFRNSEEYATFLASCCPELPPSQSPIFAFVTRTFGGQHEFCNFNLPCGGSLMNSFEDYLNYHFPALVSDFEALNLNPSTTRCELVNAVSHLIQANAPVVSWGR